MVQIFSFFRLCFRHLYQIFNNWNYMCSYLGVNFVPLGYMFVFVLVIFFFYFLICIISWALKWLFLKHCSFFRLFPYTFSDGTFSIYVKIVMDILLGIRLYFCKMVILTIFYQTMNMWWLSSFYCLSLSLYSLI